MQPVPWVRCDKISVQVPGMPSASNGKVTHEQPFPSCSFTLQELHYTGLSSSLQYQLATSSCIREEYKQWILSFLNTEPLVCPSVLFPSSQAFFFLLFNTLPLPPNQFHQSISPACLGDCCSLAIDTLITVGHIEKIVLLVVILIQLTHGSTCGRDGIIDKEE